MSRINLVQYAIAETMDTISHDKRLAGEHELLRRAFLILEKDFGKWDGSGYELGINL